MEMMMQLWRTEFELDGINLGSWYHTHTHTTVLLLLWNLSGTTRVSRYQKGKTTKGKTNLDLLEQEILSGSGICWAICKSAPHPRQPHQHPTTQFFTGRMPFLPPNQQRQSSEVNWLHCYRSRNYYEAHDMYNGLEQCEMCDAHELII